MTEAFQIVIVSDEGDRIVFQERLPNHVRQIAGALEPCREQPVGVIVEATHGW